MIKYGACLQIKTANAKYVAAEFSPTAPDTKTNKVMVGYK
jgi:hypothetical protein